MYLDSRKIVVQMASCCRRRIMEQCRYLFLLTVHAQPTESLGSDILGLGS